MAAKILERQVGNMLLRLKALRPTIWDEDSGQSRASRRVAGMFTTAGDRHGFRHTYCYVAKGVTVNSDVAAVVSALAGFQRATGASDGRHFVAAFGSAEDDLVHHPALFSCRSVQAATKAVETLTTLNGATPGASAPILTSLFPSPVIDYVGFSAPSSCDLVMIICPEAGIHVSARVQRQLRAVQRHIVWLSVGEDAVSIRVGGSLPPAWASERD